MTKITRLATKVTTFVKEQGAISIIIYIILLVLVGNAAIEVIKNWQFVLLCLTVFCIVPIVGLIMDPSIIRKHFNKGRK